MAYLGFFCRLFLLLKHCFCFLSTVHWCLDVISGRRKSNSASPCALTRCYATCFPEALACIIRSADPLCVVFSFFLFTGIFLFFLFFRNRNCENDITGVVGQIAFTLCRLVKAYECKNSINLVIIAINKPS